MSKWTWPALAAVLAVAAGSYYLLSQRQERPAAADDGLDVEAFGDDVEGEEGGDNTFELLDDVQKEGAAKPDAAARQAGEEGIKTIDDDDLGETVKDPVVIDDEEEGAVEAPKAAAPKPAPKKTK